MLIRAETFLLSHLFFSPHFSFHTSTLLNSILLMQAV